MKAAIFLVLALLAAAQARSALKTNDLYEALEKSTSWQCVERKMQHIIENKCGGVADSACFETGAALTDKIVKMCFHKELKQVAKTADRSGGPLQLLGCIAKVSWEIATGQPNPADALACLNDI